jgi:hypothetical protein
MRTRLFGLGAAAMAGCALIGGSRAMAQQSATVSVNAGTSLGTIPSTAFGVNTAVWDANLMDASVPGLLQQAGATVLRYPGGSTADVYNWQSNSIINGLSGYANPSDGFDAFMGMAAKAGSTALITVNYGSNAAGTGGGDPTLAAAWVSYAKSKSYGIKYWEIGNEVYGNGFYNGSGWETDLHDTSGSGRQGNSSLGPSAYGTNALAFISDMEAADPTIKCGVVLTAPGNWPDGVAPAWNPAVLQACGSSIDFVIVHWYAADSGLLSDSSQIAGMVSTVRSEINQYCGSNASNVQIFVTETNEVTPSVSLTNGLFLPDNYMTWLENGVANVDWWALFNGPVTTNGVWGDYGLLSVGQSPEPAADTPFPAYYGLQMLTKLGKAGDSMVSSSSSTSMVTPHAVKQANGNLALMLINKDPSNSYTVNVSLADYTPSSTGTTYTYGQNSSAITSAAASGLGSSFQTTVAPSSLNTIVLTPSANQPPPPAEAPYGGTPWPVPGTIQAENFDTGGDNVAYYTTNNVNEGGQYRTTEGVSIEDCTDTGGGYDVGWTAAGQWLKYTVNVASAGQYTVSFRVASDSTGGTLHLLDQNGNNLTGSVTVPVTGGWQTWTTVTANVTLTAGQQVIELYEDTGGYNINYMTFAQSGSSGGIQSGHVYKLTHAGTTECLDCASNGTANGTNVDTWQDNGTTAQQWVIVQLANGSYTLTHYGTNECLDVAANGTANDTNVDIWQANGTTAQEWQIVQLANGAYTLTHYGTNECLDCNANGTANGTNVDTYQSNGTTAQQWVLTFLQ